MMTRRDWTIEDICDLRGIEPETICRQCGGRGSTMYSNTSTWHHGVGGSAITSDVCDQCWGSGDEARPWTNLRQMRDTERQRIATEAVTLLARVAGCAYESVGSGVAELCTILDDLASPRKRKPRPHFFANTCEALAKTLRLGLKECEEREAERKAAK